MVPALEDGVCQVWWARSTDVRPELDHFLEPGELSRREQLVREEDKHRLTVGAALARLVLARHLDCRADRLHFDRTCPTCGAWHGKPRLTGEGGDLQFSVSHSGQRVVVAVVRGKPVGVDVEWVPDTIEVDTLAPEVLSTEELMTFPASALADRVRSLLTYWTRKEALLKATGQGLRAPMSDITVSRPEELPSLRTWSAAPVPSLVSLHDLHPGDEYVASLAILGLMSARVLELDGHGLLGNTDR